MTTVQGKYDPTLGEQRTVSLGLTGMPPMQGQGLHVPGGAVEHDGGEPQPVGSHWLDS